MAFTPDLPAQKSARLVQIIRGPGGDPLHEELLGRAAAQRHSDLVQDGLEFCTALLWEFCGFMMVDGA